MLPSCSRILAEAINTMEMQWVAYDQVVYGSSDAVVIRQSKIVSCFLEKRFRTVRIENYYATHYSTEIEKPWYIKTLHT